MMRENWIRMGPHKAKVSFEEDWVRGELLKGFIPSFPDSKYEPDLIIVIVSGFGTSFKNYEVGISETKRAYIYERADYRIVVDKNYKSSVLYIHDALSLKHALMNLYSAFIVNEGAGVLFHSSCVQEQERAFLFTGNSGAGKSTAAKLSAPRNILADEATIIHVKQDDIIAYPSPFRSEIPMGIEHTCLKVGGIQSLHQSLTNNKVLMESSEAIVHLMDKIFYWPATPEDHKKALQLLKTIVEQVPIYHLYFREDSTFWELIS
ncbi:hypothetical protein ACJA3J_17885 [Halobacillus sp. SY10]|uniref:hypothetical protein n=1 Tax=Halobacillus sp. SY10 TaxID=3381356 RepID=UPI00387A5301